MSSGKLLISRIIYKFLSKVYRLLFIISQPYFSNPFILPFFYTLAMLNAQQFPSCDMPTQLYTLGILVGMHAFYQKHINLSLIHSSCLPFAPILSFSWCNKIISVRLSIASPGTITHSFPTFSLLWNVLCYYTLQPLSGVSVPPPIQSENKLGLSYTSLFCQNVTKWPKISTQQLFVNCWMNLLTRWRLQWKISRFIPMH